jgi:Pathogen effector
VRNPTTNNYHCQHVIVKMKSLKGLAALAMFFSSMSAAPISSADITSNQSSPSVLFKRALDNNSIRDCGDSSYDNQTSGASPTGGDCIQITKNIAGGGSWEVESSSGDQHQLVQYGSCALGVQGHTGGGSLFHVGNQDIINIIYESINKYMTNGLVGSKGTMTCQGEIGGDVTVDWGLYHT